VFEGGFVQDSLLLGATDEEGVEAQGVNLAGNALGVLMGAGDEAIAEDGALGADDAQVVLDVTGGLGQIEGR